MEIDEPAFDSEDIHFDAITATIMIHSKNDAMVTREMIGRDTPEPPRQLCGRKLPVDKKHVL